ncbi:MAG: ABC transporter permease [Longimicrobiales bacterium]
MNWSDVGILYRHELRGALRERLVVVNSILVPLLLYPAILWVTFSALALVEGLMDRLPSHIAVHDAASHAGLRNALAQADGIVVEPEAALDEDLRRVRRRDLDATLQLMPAGDALAGNVDVVVTFDGATDAGRRAASRIEEVVERWRAGRVADAAAARSIGPAALEVFRVEPRDVATGEERGAFQLAQLVPLFLVVMVALGCFVPAIDATAGERERATWETLMTTAASRGSIVLAKYLYVATLGTAAGVLNVLAVALTLGPALRPLLGDSEAVRVSLPAAAIPVMVIGAAALALFFAAAMMILASFARTFRDGQAMIMPVYWLALIPIVLGAAPDPTLTPGLALVPIANIAMALGDAVRGVFHWPLLALALAVELATVAGCLLIARRVLQFEELLLGSYGGSFFRFARERLLGRNVAERSA